LASFPTPTDSWTPKIPELFAGVSHILHAGDIARMPLLPSWRRWPGHRGVRQHGQFPHLRATATVALAGRKFLVHHIVEPSALKEPLRLRIARSGRTWWCSATRTGPVG